MGTGLQVLWGQAPDLMAWFSSSREFACWVCGNNRNKTHQNTETLNLKGVCALSFPARWKMFIVGVF